MVTRLIVRGSGEDTLSDAPLMLGRPRIGGAAIRGVLLLMLMAVAIAATTTLHHNPWGQGLQGAALGVIALGLARVGVLEHRRRVLVAEEFSIEAFRTASLRERGVSRVDLDWLQLRDAFLATDPSAEQVRIFTDAFHPAYPGGVEIELDKWRNVLLISNWFQIHEFTSHSTMLAKVAHELEFQAQYDYFRVTELAREFRGQGEYERADFLDQLFGGPPPTPKDLG